MESRYEMRFFISPDQVERLRDFVREYLDLDAYSVGRPDYSYAVHTLHLDSDDWKLYWRAVRGDQDRWKLRMRYYSNRPDAPVFCEIKHQMTDVVVKHRAVVRPEELPALLAGQLPEAGPRPARDTDGREAVDRFVGLLVELNARPRLYIGCRREAYQSEDGHARVTLDRGLTVGEWDGDGLEGLPTGTDRPLLNADHTVILELRFTDRFPHWYRELAGVLRLGQSLVWDGSPARLSCHGLQLTEGELVYNIVL